MSNFTFLKTEWPDLHEAAVKVEALAILGARLKPSPRLQRGVLINSQIGNMLLTGCPQ
jgi:hypothetical protein